MPELDPFAGLAAVLGTLPIQVDAHRQARKGVPEVVYAAGKTPHLALASVRELLDKQPRGRVLVSRAAAEVVELLRSELEPTGASVLAAPTGGTVLVRRRDASSPVATGGVVGLLTAGTSDAPAADEAAWVAQEMGCRVVRADDVGVAGLHRLEAPLRMLRELGADVVIVAAGMDGALPSVVSGLVDVPVIGLPTSVGYGLGGGGVAALLAMLQTCAPGLVVVNIDNGVGAGATAALLANRVATARGSA
ncbi:MAG: nickel pincer cofactor biosynthesis protein LarB [Chloroflexota bacterium]|nr:nickel pincer cofactor biosynthesis protein LarB [Chloroflexota bacterium]